MKHLLYYLVLLCLVQSIISLQEVCLHVVGVVYMVVCVVYMVVCVVEHSCLLLNMVVSFVVLNICSPLKERPMMTPYKENPSLNSIMR